MVTRQYTGILSLETWGFPSGRCDITTKVVLSLVLLGFA